MSSYLKDYHAQRRHLSRLTRALGLPFSRQGPTRKLPLSNNELRVGIHDACLGPDWGACTDGRNAAAFDQMLGRMADTLEMRNGFNLAAAQALIKAGKWAMAGARAAHARGKPHGYVMSRLKPPVITSQRRADTKTYTNR
jgi:hypothetical protein